MYHYFIINPVAVRIQHEEVIEILKDILKTESYAYNVTEHVWHARQLAFEAAANHADIRIYSIGGDGTLNEVANGIVESGNKEAVLVPIPLGSGNDFVRSLGYKKEKDLRKLIDRAVSCSYIEIDLCKANDRYFLNISSLGFDAQVVANAIAYKKNKFIPKGLAYYLSVFTTFVRMKFYPLTITVDDKETFDNNTTLLAVANGRYYGGGIIPVPGADIQDGCFDVCLVDKVRRIKVPIFFPMYAKGNHGKLKEVNFFKCRKLHVKCNNGFVSLNIDGELSKVKEVLFEVVNRKIRVGQI